jgi:hypothetical protein
VGPLTLALRVTVKHHFVSHTHAHINANFIQQTAKFGTSHLWSYDVWRELDRFLECTAHEVVCRLWVALRCCVDSPIGLAAVYEEGYSSELVRYLVEGIKVKKQATGSRNGLSTT